MSKDKFQHIIVIDTREQTPWAFGEGFQTVNCALPAGDYSVMGYEHEIAIERKNINDLAQTVIKDRRRFHKELSKLAGYRHKAVVVEAKIEDILLRKYSSNAHPFSVLGACSSFHAIYGVPFLWWDSRQTAELMAKMWLQWAARIEDQRKEAEKNGMKDQEVEDRKMENKDGNNG